MRSALFHRIEQKENNLNAIRLLLAILVLFSHCFSLSLGMEAASHFHLTGKIGNAAVDLFFFISGLLITASWLRSKSVGDYLRKRVLRIYPGFVGALLVSTIIITAVNPSGLLGKVVSWQGLKSIIQDAVWLSQNSLSGPDVFPANPIPNYADGSMWTIPIEFRCYLGVLVIGLFCLFKFRWLVLGAFIYTYLLVVKAVLMERDITGMDRRFFTFFLAGICAWLWRDKIPLHWSIALSALVLIAFSHFIHLPWLIVEPLALTYIFLWLGYANPLKATRWCDTTDLSYGVYLYAFPMQQLIATTAWGRNPGIMFFTALPITLIVAFGSWHLIEKPFLNMKSSKFIDRDPAVPSDIAASAVQLKQAF